MNLHGISGKWNSFGGGKTGEWKVSKIRWCSKGNPFRTREIKAVEENKIDKLTIQKRFSNFMSERNARTKFSQRFIVLAMKRIGLKQEMRLVKKNKKRDSMIQTLNLKSENSICDLKTSSSGMQTFTFKMNRNCFNTSIYQNANFSFFLWISSDRTIWSCVSIWTCLFYAQRMKNSHLNQVAWFD